MYSPNVAHLIHNKIWNSAHCSVPWWYSRETDRALELSDRQTDSTGALRQTQFWRSQTDRQTHSSGALRQTERHTARSSQTDTALELSGRQTDSSGALRQTDCNCLLMTHKVFSPMDLSALKLSKGIWYNWRRFRAHCVSAWSSRCEQPVGFLCLPELFKKFLKIFLPSLSWFFNKF